MIEAHWWALVQGATICTLLWLFVPEWLNDQRGERSRIPPLTLTSAALWLTAGMTASDLERITETGATVAVDAGVFAYVCLAAGAVSVLTFLLFLWGAYPPQYLEIDGQTQSTEMTTDEL